MPWVLQFFIPFTHRCYMLYMVEIGLLVSDKKLKYWKVYEQRGQKQIEVGHLIDSDDLKNTKCFHMN